METAASEDTKRTLINFECALEIREGGNLSLPGKPRGKTEVPGASSVVFLFSSLCPKGYLHKMWVLCHREVGSLKTRLTMK